MSSKGEFIHSAFGTTGAERMPPAVKLEWFLRRFRQVKAGNTGSCDADNGWTA
jgi:hypothetical protein